jgi:hypothetical protein
MPPSHQRWLEWTPERFGRWARKIGPFCATLISAIIDSRPLPQQGFRSALGILRLEKDYGDLRLETACRRALEIGATSYSSLQSILKRGIDQTPLPEPSSSSEIGGHENIRGAGYYR